MTDQIDFGGRGDTSGQVFRLQDYVVRRQTNSLSTPPRDEPSAEETYTESLRASRLSSRAAPARKQDPFLSPENRAYLVDALVARAPPTVEPEQVRTMAPAWIKAARPAGPVGEANRKFIADRVAFMTTHSYLVRAHAAGDRREDDPARYNSGEFNSVYWDANRALSVQRPTGLRELGVPGQRDQPMLVAERPAFPNPERGGISSSRGAQKDAEGLRQDRGDGDRSMALFRAMQERSDRQSREVQGRQMRLTVRSDMGQLSGPIAIEGLPRPGANFQTTIADRLRESRAATARLRKLQNIYR